MCRPPRCAPWPTIFGVSTDYLLGRRDGPVPGEENQALREQVETLRGEFQLTKGHKVKPASIGKLADTILKETSSSYD